MCRQSIPVDYFNRPEVIQLSSSFQAPQTRGDKKKEKEKEKEEEEGEGEEAEETRDRWFYAGRGGWWEYDERTATEIESAFRAQKSQVELLIAGHMYVIHFQEMVQYRRNEPGRKRQIKRDASNTQCKGVAGLKINKINKPTDLSHSSDTSECVDRLRHLNLEDNETDQNGTGSHT